MHALFFCCTANYVWKEVGLWGTIKKDLHEDVVELLLGLWKSLSSEVFELCCVVM